MTWRTRLYTDDGHSVRDEEIEKYYEYLRHMAQGKGYDTNSVPESKKTKRQKRQRPKLHVMNY